MPSEEVASAFRAYPPESRKQLLRMRDLIFETAESMPEVGQLEEALRWGQPAYLTPQSKSGSTIRLGAMKDDADRLAIFVNCQTTLVETFRAMFDDVLQFESKRAIVVSATQSLPVEQLTECIAMALTYHRPSRRRK